MSRRHVIFAAAALLTSAVLIVPTSGLAAAKLANLTATNVQASAFASGHATVRATHVLNARVFGSGTDRYIGNPGYLHQQNFGSGLS